MSTDTKWIIGTIVVLGGVLSAQIVGVGAEPGGGSLRGGPTCSTAAGG